jgi:putative ABC transport system substrate-binding protein
MLVLPQAVVTQQAGRVYRIGFLGVASASASVTRRRIEAFRTGMRTPGYVEGSNVINDFRWAEGDANRLAELAGELIRLRVDLLVTLRP